MRRFLIAVAATLAMEAAVAAAIVALGLAPVAADQGPSALETRLLGFAMRRAVERNARGDAPPPVSSTDAASGEEIYKELCARCHGEPGAKSSPLARSFHPPAPILPARGSEWSERELFWIIKHGIRNTGMPAWGALLSDDDIHQVAALVKGFPRR